MEPRKRPPHPKSLHPTCGRIFSWPHPETLLSQDAGATFSGAVGYERISTTESHDWPILLSGPAQREIASGLVFRPVRSRANTDSDGDGLPDRLEAYLGSDATRADDIGALLSARVDSGTASFSFFESVTPEGPQATVWWSRDLLEWRKEGVSMEVGETVGGRRPVSATVSLDASPIFFRLVFAE